MPKLDFILSFIQAAIRAILRAKALRKSGDLQASADALDGACESLLGFTVDAAVHMPLASLLDLLSCGPTDASRALTMAALFKERGHLHEACHNHKESIRCYRQAFCLYDEITQLAPDTPELAEHEESIRELMKHLEAHSAAAPMTTPTAASSL